MGKIRGSESRIPLTYVPVSTITNNALMLCYVVFLFFSGRQTAAIPTRRIAWAWAWGISCRQGAGMYISVFPPPYFCSCDGWNACIDEIICMMDEASLESASNQSSLGSPIYGFRGTWDVCTPLLSPSPCTHRPGTRGRMTDGLTDGRTGS